MPVGDVMEFMTARRIIGGYLIAFATDSQAASTRTFPDQYLVSHNLTTVPILQEQGSIFPDRYVGVTSHLAKYIS